MNVVTSRDGNEFEVFAQLSKINEKTGEFEAWATFEEVDASGEIIDLDKSWPYFEALANRFAKATDGTNYGPLREQHDPNKASGHLIAPPVMKTHDETGTRGVYINGLVTDENTKKKLVAKTLTGVSIGGKYVGDGEVVKVGGVQATRFIANPNHYGLVDAPCVKNALVTMVKADGTTSVEKLIGYDPPQGFLCRGEEFHTLKPEARRCTAHISKSDGNADPATEKAYAASETANGYSYAAPSGQDSAEYHRKAQAAHVEAASAHRAAQAASKDSGDNTQARHHAKTAEKHDDAAVAHGAIAAAHEAAMKVASGGALQKRSATECACCKDGGCDCDSRVAADDSCSCHSDCQKCEDNHCEGLAAEKMAAHGQGATMTKVAQRDDTSAANGENKYGDVAFADTTNKKYPIDTAPHIRAAWNYVSKPKNADKYSADDLKTIKAKIVAAWKDKIDKDGPPSAAKSEPSGLLAKCLNCVAILASATQSIDQIADGIHCEACGAYGCNCSYCTGPKDGCCYACSMQFGVDMPLSDNTLATLEASSKQLFDALVSAAEDCRDADAAEDADEAVEAMKALGALTSALNDGDTLKKLQDALRVPRSNGSEKNKASKEGTVSKEIEIEKVDGAQLLKGIGELNKTIGELTTLVKADHGAIATAVEDISKLDDGLTNLSKRLSETMAAVADVTVDDPTDLAKVMKAIQDKPGPGKPAVRAMKKVDDSVVDSASVTAPARHPFDVEPMRIGA